jgi:subfamily B ATP-binding cassette protein MsbA
MELSIRPLRERPDDLEPLATYWLDVLGRRHGRAVPQISADALGQLRAHRWSGNVRELRNVLERAVCLGTGPMVSADDVARALSSHGSAIEAPAGRRGGDEISGALSALEAARWNRTVTARRLGISRSTLWRRLKRHGLTGPLGHDSRTTLSRVRGRSAERGPSRPARPGMALASPSWRRTLQMNAATTLGSRDTSPDMSPASVDADSSLRSDVRQACLLFRGAADPAPFRCSELRWLRPYVRGRAWRIAVAAASLVAAAVAGAAVPAVMMLVVDSVLPAKDAPAFSLAVLALGALHLIRPACSFTAGYQLSVVGQSVQSAIRADLFQRLVRLPVNVFDKGHTGYLTARLAEVRGLSALFSQAMLAPVLIAAECSLSLAAMLYIDWRLTAMLAVVVPPFFLVARLQARGLRRSTSALMEQGAVVSQRIQESLSGVRTIKEHGTEHREARQIAGSLHALGRAGVIQAVAQALTSESMAIGVGMAGVALLWLSGTAIMAGTFTIGAYVAFTVYFVKFLAPVQVLTSFGLVLQQTGVALRRLAELERQVPEDESPDRVLTLERGACAVSFQHVSFRYDGGDRDVIDDMTAEIGSGECVAVVGPSGSGKSTLVKLLLGLYPVSSGAILVDGLDSRTITLASLRDRIGVVSQGVFLFNDTIRRNILYSRPDATEAELIAAAVAADAHEFICRLPQGYDTLVGERGATLSGGQRQRISIARTLLRRPGIVVFDEATSELDAASERRVWRDAARAFAGSTRIVISHHWTPVVNADRVIVLVNGRVAATGRPADLLLPDSPYRELRPEPA